MLSIGFQICTSIALCAAVASAQAAYTIVELDVPVGASNTVPLGINNKGDVVGMFRVGNITHAFRYTDDLGMDDLGTLTGTATAMARGTNDLGEVVGDSGPHAFRFTPGSGLEDFTNGMLSRANAINNSGWIVGTLDPNSFSFASFLYTPAAGLSQLISGSGRAYDINELGQVVGISGLRAFRHTQGVGLEIIPVPPDRGYFSSRGLAINDLGQVAGTLHIASGSVVDLFRFTNGVGVEILGALGPSGFVYGMNNVGAIVGVRDVGLDHAFLYTPEAGIQNLNFLIPDDSGYSLSKAYGINEVGQIAISAWHTATTSFRALRLDPIVRTAASVKVGEGCGGGFGPPRLGSSVPVLGQILNLELRNATPQHIATMFLSVGGPTRTVLGLDCFAFLDRTAFFPAARFSTDLGGSALVSFVLPVVPELLGLMVTMQAAVFATSSPLGLEVSNAQLLILGM